MTAPDHSPIVDGLITAREALAGGEVLAAMEIIETLHATYGALAVQAISAALAAGPGRAA